MPELPIDELRRELLQKKSELTARLDRISANLQRGFAADSKEMAKERLKRHMHFDEVGQ